ncbi:hypothetical protein NQT62_04015 [Limnobacter humi]|uniref:Uncharacterized protein n=1 Tax=Limnobacter humi TaxID=1778671 RepID=A0ABT1WDL5_9BURK|nr:hypothetical protein [Limnobacter humi]MCQ8895608.1 hypothetical protein [Limnobacter humi]
MTDEQLQAAYERYVQSRGDATPLPYAQWKEDELRAQQRGAALAGKPWFVAAVVAAFVVFALCML